MDQTTGAAKMMAYIGFTDGKETTSCTLEVIGNNGFFVRLAWCEDDSLYDNSEEFRQYWKDFHRITDGAFDDLLTGTVEIPAHRITFIRSGK